MPLDNPKLRYQINYGNKGSAYIHNQEYEDSTSWEWCTDYDELIRSSNSFEEAIEDSKNQIDEYVEDFGMGINDLQPDESWLPVEEFDPDNF